MAAMRRNGERVSDRFGRAATGAAALPAPGPTRDLLERAAALASRRGTRLAWVGGGVRDLLLGRETLDVDLAIEGDATTFASILAAELGGHCREHPRFLAATIELPDGRALDVARCRRETYPAPGALPKVEPATLEEDLARRDFSMNAIAVPLTPGDLDVLDPTGGAADLAAGRLRALHSASFLDDPTRAIRGLRFEVRLGFRFDAETETWLRAALAAGALDTISGERLRRELDLACEAWPRLSVLFERAAELGLLGAIDPGLGWSREAAMRIERSARRAVEPALARLAPSRWLVGLLGLDPPAEVRLRLLRRLALAGRFAEVLRACGPRIAEARTLLRSEPPPAPHRVARALEDASPEELCRLASEEGSVARWIGRYLAELRPLSLRVRGDDLLRAGLPAGPEIGAALRATLEARQDGRIGAEQELEFAREAWGREGR
jgi:tRNA nucleotidyltransferase (CCA-adding enzyme)